jgi:hypothetical protein
VDLRSLDPDQLCAQVRERLEPGFAFYGLAPSPAELRQAAAEAVQAHLALRRAAADLAAELVEDALGNNVQVALVVGREYVLNPGIYDSHVRRLLRDKGMAAIPSYVLDLELDPDFSDICWRNPHFIVSLLNAVAHRRLHRRLRHPRLREAFGRIESGERLLPVVQVSTFSCGPDGITSHLVAEIMKVRPFLLIQSDAVLKELAHLENRVPTYVKQLELGLHDRLRADDGRPLEIGLLGDLINREPLNRDTDLIYFPTLGDNRALTAVLRGAGFACVDNYAEGHDLHALVKEGRKAAGDAVCAPLAGVYGDLLRAMQDFDRRRRAGDPLVAGRHRLLYFDNKGLGPCRQGQYVEVHKLLALRNLGAEEAADRDNGCGPVGGALTFKFLVGTEAAGYDIGAEEWVLLRMYLSAVLQGVLHGLLFAGAECRDYEEYGRFLEDYQALKYELYRALEAFTGPGPFARLLLRAFRGRSAPALLARFLAARPRDPALLEPIRRFAAKWNRAPAADGDRLRIAISGEIYMRVAHAEDIFRSLLASQGFRRFRLELSPLWSYLEYLLDEMAVLSRDAAKQARARIDQGDPGDWSGKLRDEGAMQRRIEFMRFAPRRRGCPCRPPRRGCCGRARRSCPRCGPSANSSPMSARRWRNCATAWTFSSTSPPTAAWWRPWARCSPRPSRGCRGPRAGASSTCSPPRATSTTNCSRWRCSRAGARNATTGASRPERVRGGSSGRAPPARPGSPRPPFPAAAAA